MKAIVNEPLPEYKVSGWLPKTEPFPFDENISSIENKTITVYPSQKVFHLVFKIPHKRLSLLRGKMTKQSEKEIDDQISDLRNEWDRNI